VRAIVRAPVDWHAGLRDEERQAFWFDWRTLGILAALAGGPLLRGMLLQKLGTDPALDQPMYARRLVAAVAKSVADGVVPAAVVAAVYLRVRASETVMSGFAGEVVASACLMLIFFVLSAAFSRAVLAPDLPAWRLTALDPKAARTAGP
jgi:small-conductance mechanosensitive channel